LTAAQPNSPFGIRSEIDYENACHEFREPRLGFSNGMNQLPVEWR
jgi:hypothetical protein